MATSGCQATGLYLSARLESLIFMIDSFLRKSQTTHFEEAVKNNELTQNLCKYYHKSKAKIHLVNNFFGGTPYL